MKDLYGAWIAKQPFARDFVLFLTSRNTYLISSQVSNLGSSDLAIEWGDYRFDFSYEINNKSIDPYGVKPHVAKINFDKDGFYGTDSDISSRLQGQWSFVPPKLGEPKLSEITINGGFVDALVRCQSIEPS